MLCFFSILFCTASYSLGAYKKNPENVVVFSIYGGDIEISATPYYIRYPYSPNKALNDDLQLSAILYFFQYLSYGNKIHKYINWWKIIRGHRLGPVLKFPYPWYLFLFFCFLIPIGTPIIHEVISLRSFLIFIDQMNLSNKNPDLLQ